MLDAHQAVTVQTRKRPPHSKFLNSLSFSLICGAVTSLCATRLLRPGHALPSILSQSVCQTKGQRMAFQRVGGTQSERKNECSWPTRWQREKTGESSVLGARHSFLWKVRQAVSVPHLAAQ